MIKLRKADQRGHANHGWLDSHHSFSFADYYDPAEMGWSVLRVINDDRVEPGMGFGMHGHRDMEIITYVLDGALQHKDNMGNGEVIRPGDVQRMSAGRGVMHSEFNASQSESVHFLQIWIVPNVRGVAPGYEQKFFSSEEKRGRLRLIASNDGRDGSVSIHQQADLYAAVLGEGESAKYEVTPQRVAYAHVARGTLRLNQQLLEAGDGARIDAGTQIEFQGTSDGGEVLLFDLPNQPE